MRIFDPEKGTVIRKGLESLNGANGGRASAMERKVFTAALDLLKEEDEELGKMIAAAIASAEKKTSEQIDKLRDDIKGQEKDVWAVKDVLDAMRDGDKKMKAAHRELLDFIEKTGDSVAEAVGEMKPMEMKESKHPRIKSLPVVRGPDGKIKRVDVEYED